MLLRFQSLNRDRGLSNSQATTWALSEATFQSLNRDRGLSNCASIDVQSWASIGFNPSIGIGGFQTRAKAYARDRSHVFQSLNRDRGLSNQI